MSSHFKINTRNQWSALNPVLMAGEPGIEDHARNVKVLAMLLLISMLRQRKLAHLRIQAFPELSVP